MNELNIAFPRHKLAIRSKLFTAIALLLMLITVTLTSPWLWHPISAKTSKTKTTKDTNLSESVKASLPAQEKDDAGEPHLLAASYYSMEGNLTATLMLLNQGPQPLVVQPTLFSMAGERFDAAPLTIEGKTLRAIDLRDWVAAAGVQFREGSLQVFYRGEDLLLGGVVKLSDADRSLIFDEELTEPATMFPSSRLEGVWWLPSRRSEMRLVVSNTTDSPLSVIVMVNDTVPRQKGPEALTLQPHETRVMNVQDLTGEEGGALSEIGGISIKHSGGKGALLARAMIEDASMGYSAVVEFSDPQRAKSSKLDGAGLRVGKAGGENLTPIVVARNIGDAATVVTGRIPYTMSDGSMSAATLPKLHITPGEARTINLAEAIKSISPVEKVISAGLEFEYRSAPGSIVMSAQSVSASGTHVFRVPLVDAAAQPSSTGGYPGA